MYEKDKREIIHTALEIKSNGLIALSGGNVSVRKENGDIIVTPSGTPYETMQEDDLIVFNASGERIEGTLRESVDTVALKYIYDQLPEVNAIIHTHQPYATAVGLIGDKFPAALTTLANVTLGEVNVAPYCSAASMDMGVQSVKYLGGKRAVILKHHGVITVGGKLKDALYAAVYMEEAAKAYLAAKAAGNVAIMTEEQTADAVEIHRTYGQHK
jgi:L-ribulose-5-phosphate 4-epimerase